MRAFGCPDKFVKLELQGFTVAVLGVLDEEYHEEGYHAGTCVDYQLPSIGVVKNRPGY